MNIDTYDAVVVGGGPAGATAATDLARRGRAVLLLDRAGRIKPCGGAIPPRLLTEFDVPESVLKTKVHGARIVSPSARSIDMPIANGYVGMVDREQFDEWLRNRADLTGAARREGEFLGVSRATDDVSVVHYRDHSGVRMVRARAIVGADGAKSRVARECIAQAGQSEYVFAYHEIVRSPTTQHGNFDASRCEVVYQGNLSPDFYSWIFPHGSTISVGTGTAVKGFSLRDSVRIFREQMDLANLETIRREGAPIPLRPLKVWDNSRDVVLAGDAAGVVAPASGEGIYYAMVGGRLAAQAVDEFLTSRDARALCLARRRFMKMHGRVFWVLGLMQRFWYSSDKRRERFVSMCRDPDVQRLTWEAYMHKRLVRSDPLAHARIFFKDLAHLTGLVRP